MNDNLGLILSTGRTGTKFFEYFINNYTQNSFCLHEPKPSRRFKFYSNLFLQNKLKADFIRKQYNKNRKKIYASAKDINYIESNNFLFGCATPLNSDKNVKVLHMVREPKSYIISHLKHGFWHGHKKFFAKYIPYWLEGFSMKNANKNNPVHILAKRWFYVNTTINSYEDVMPYLRIRFEDLFSSDVESSVKAINQILDFFNLDLKPGVNLGEIMTNKQNKGTKQNVSSQIIENERNLIKEFCEPLATNYHYEL